MKGSRAAADPGSDAGRGLGKLKVLEYEQLRVEHLQKIQVQESVAAKARAATLNIDAQMARLRQAFAKTASSEMATAEDEPSLRGEELRKSERRRSLQQLRSPVDGVVQQPSTPSAESSSRPSP